MHNKASYYPKSMNAKTEAVLVSIAVVNERLVLDVKADPGLERPAGILVCEPWTEADTAAVRAQWEGLEEEHDPVLSLTVTRFGRLFHDEGRFTEREAGASRCGDDQCACRYGEACPKEDRN